MKTFLLQMQTSYKLLSSRPETENGIGCYCWLYGTFYKGYIQFKKRISGIVSIRMHKMLCILLSPKACAQWYCNGKKSNLNYWTMQMYVWRQRMTKLNFNQYLKPVMKAFKAVHLFSLLKINVMRPSSSNVGELSVFPFSGNFNW